MLHEIAAQEVYPGCSRLIEELDKAVASSTVPEKITHAVQATLHDLLSAREVLLPERLRQPSPSSYARRLVHVSPELGYSVLAMVWGPGQGTGLHNHAGMWCVEGVVEGLIEVTQYSLLDRSGSLYRFQPEGSGKAGVGEAGRLIPPHEYHVLRNAVPGESSITIHVYGGEMNRCSVFEPRTEDWYEEVTKILTLTN
jgi:3-mercaptopropionate dioxygenase